MSKKTEEQQDCDSGYKSIESALETLSLEDDTSSLEGSQPATQSGQQSRSDCSKEVENSTYNCFKIQDCAEVKNSEEKGGTHLLQDKDGDNLLHLQICHGNEQEALNLTESVDWYSLNAQNKLGQTPLFLAVLMQNRRVIRKLIDLGVDIDNYDENGNSIIHVVAESGLDDALHEIFMLPNNRHLSKFEATLKDVLESKNFEGYTPLILAVRNNNLRTAELLCQIGADVDAMDLKAGFTALHHVVLTGNVDMVFDFIEKCSPDVNAVSYSGVTPLHLASTENESPIADILIISGADTRKETIEGFTWNNLMGNRLISVG